MSKGERESGRSFDRAKGGIDRLIAQGEREREAVYRSIAQRERERKKEAAIDRLQEVWERAREGVVN